jgi:hypothetical protein
MTHNRAIWLLLALVAAWFASVEAASRWVLNPKSRVNARILREQREAAHLTLQTGSARTLLLVGNSLLESGVVMPELNRHLAPDWNTQRFVIERTGFFDWYYGLRRLWRAGTRPSAVVMMMSTRQLMLPQVREEFFAHFLMDYRDLAAVTGQLNLHPTVASGFALGRVSQFYGTRSDIRNLVLDRLIPGMPTLAPKFAPAGPRRELDPELVQRRVRENLTLLRSLSDESGVPMLIVIPPTPERLNYLAQVLAGASEAGVRVLAPVASEEYGPEFFADEFHLNRAGASDFTPRLAAALKLALRK